jgi:REP element-mobilizing transposase RayT
MPSPALLPEKSVVPQTIGYHLVKSGYGLWLPGDQRGHWSEAWDEEIGYYESHRLHEGDLVRMRMAQERMKHPPTRLDAKMIAAVAAAVGRCAAQSDWRVAAAAIEATHMHLLMTYTTRDVDRTAKWIAQETTKSVHRHMSFTGPVWCEGKWLGFIFDVDHWDKTRAYIERHNVRRGLPAQPWDWITP